MSKSSDVTARGRPRAVIFTRFFPPAVNGGGPLRTVDALTRAAPSRFSLEIVTSDRDLGASERLPVARNTWSDMDCRSVYFASADRVVAYCMLVRNLVRSRPGIIYVNSFFDPLFSLVPQLFARRAPVVVAPRGEFAPSALSLKPARKRALIALYRFLGRHRRTTWHASSPRERDDIRRLWGDGVRIVVRENETSLPSRARRPDDASTSSSGESGRPMSVAVVSRVSPVKGLDIILSSLPLIRQPLTVDVYGNREDETYAAHCEHLAAQVPANISVRFHGGLSHEQVQRRLRTHDLMVMATHGENFGHAIAEALAASCPVAIPDTTPWTARITQGGGRIVHENTPAAWADLLSEWAALSPEERMERRRRAGGCFDRWRSADPQPHLFDQVSAGPESSCRSQPHRPSLR